MTSTCQYAACNNAATVKCRFGDGYYASNSGGHGGPGARGRPVSASPQLRRQTFVRYCDDHFQLVNRLFVLCDVTVEDRPNGPLRRELPGRHPDLVARLSP